MHKPAVHARRGVRRWAGSPTARPSLPDESGMNPVRSLASVLWRPFSGIYDEGWLPVDGIR